MDKKNKVVFYVDGYNLFHAIETLKENHLKWLDIRKLCSHFAPNAHHDIIDIHFFSAITWNNKERANQEKYFNLLKESGVNLILGRFQKNTFQDGKRTIISHEEKETDVNLALALLDDAYKDRYDRAIIISRDSDFSPAITMVRSQFPRKSIKVLSPILKPSYALMKACGTTKPAKIKPYHLEHSLFPGEVELRNGVIIKRPSAYRLPEFHFDDDDDFSCRPR